MRKTDLKILIIGEDFPEDYETERVLKGSGMITKKILLGSMPIDKVNIEGYDAVLIDIVDVAFDPESYLKKICNRKVSPVIVVSPCDDPVKHITALETGADDFIVKPCNPHVLAAKIRSLYRLMNNELRPGSEELKLGDLCVNRTGYVVTLCGETVPMPLKEFELLYLLASNPDKVFSRQELLKRVWGYNFGGKSRTVDVHIKRIRGKIEKESSDMQISTVWGVGYKLEQRQAAVSFSAP